MLEAGTRDIQPAEAENIATSKVAGEPVVQFSTFGETLKIFTRLSHYPNRIFHFRNVLLEPIPDKFEFKGMQLQPKLSRKYLIQENLNCFQPDEGNVCEETKGAIRVPEKIHTSMNVNSQDVTYKNDPCQPKLDSNRLLNRAICILKRIVNQFRPDINVENRDLTATLFDLLKAMYEVIRDDGFDKFWLDKVIRLLKCVECQLCGQGAGDLDAAWELRALQEVIQEKLCKETVQGDCLELKETSRICRTINELLTIISMRDPTFSFESNHAKCKILEALTYIDSCIQFTNMGSKSLAKLCHLLKNLQHEVGKQCLGYSDFAQTVLSFSKAAWNAMNKREFQEFQEKIENVPFLARIVVALNSVLCGIKKDHVCSLKACKWKLLGLLNLAETALEAKHHEKYKLQKLTNLLGDLKCELYQRNMAKQKIIKKIVEVESMVRSKLFYEEPKDELQVTPQLCKLLNTLHEMILCVDQCATIPNCTVEQQTIQILKMICDKLDSGQSGMRPKPLELLLDALECEIRIQGYEGKDIFRLIEDIQWKLEEIEPEPAGVDSKMTHQKLLNALNAMKLCCAKFLEEINLFCEGDSTKCKDNSSSQLQPTS